MKECRDIRHCDFKEYINCPAKQIGKNCWGFKKGCLCGLDKSIRCSNCFIYAEHFSELKDLIALARNKDDKAIEELFKEYSKEVRKIQKYFYFPSGDFRDVLQEGMVGLYFAILTYDEKKDPVFENYVDRSIRNQIMQVLRKLTSNKQKVLNYPVPLEEFNREACNTIPPEEAAIGYISKVEIEKGMERRLTKLELKIIKLFLSGHKNQEMANFLKISTKQIENALFRARKKIHTLVAELNR